MMVCSLKEVTEVITLDKIGIILLLYDTVTVWLGTLLVCVSLILEFVNCSEVVMWNS